MLQTFESSTPERIHRQTDKGYPYSRIWINGRHVYIEKILSESESPRSPFEQTTFGFIKDWLSGVDKFTMTTSGSTGVPKPIEITRAQMIASATGTVERLRLQKNSTALVCIDPRYIGGRMMLVRCLVFGWRILAIEPSANPLTNIPIDNCVQFTAFVPYQVQKILESKHPHLLNGPDKILIGGAPLSASTREQLDRFQCECYETYGMTETISHVALRLANTRMKQPYFEVMPGVEIEQDARGCLVVSANYLPNKVVTNDIVEFIAPGKFRWLGRWDSVINSGGVKVMPEKIEQQLEAIFHANHFHHRFFIAAMPDESLGSKVVLILEGVQFSSEVLNQSLAALESAVSPYEVPREVYSIPSFITTATQKIDRNQTLAGVALLSSLK